MLKPASFNCESCGRLVTRSDKPGVIYCAFIELRFCSPACSAAALRLDPVENFFSKVEKTDGCWIWRGGLSPKGYGVHWVGKGHKRAHRYSYEIHHGVDPGRQVVMHSCDNRSCVNPEHLSLGTQRDNIADMDRKGRRRAPRGIGHGQCKLTPAQVLSIRADARKHRDIADDYPISASTVTAIKAGRLWKHL